VSKTVTRAALAESAAQRCNAAKSDVAAISEAMFEMIGQALMSGETVKLTAFGSLQVRSRAERIGRNPRTGTEHRIPPRYTVVFTPSAQLRTAMDEASETLAGQV